MGEAGPEAVIPLNKIGGIEGLSPALAPEITIEMEPVIVKRENGDFVINIVRKSLAGGQLMVPIKAVGG